MRQHLIKLVRDRIARKLHRCSYCGDKIYRNDAYDYRAFKSPMSGRLIEDFACGNCSANVDDFRSVHDWSELYDNDVSDIPSVFIDWQNKFLLDSRDRVW